MRNVLFVFLLLNVFLVANAPSSGDFTNPKLVNGNGEGSSKTSQISIVIDINTTNVAQFKHPTSSSSTTITKGSSHDDILLAKITYNSQNPIRAKIRGAKLIFVYNLVDNNKTNVVGNVVIKSNVLRDGAIGGAFNSADITININDKATPILLSAETVDFDTDGHIDNIKLQFTENISNSPNNNGFSVSSHAILGISADAGTGERNDTVSRDIIYLRLKESTSYDTGTQPSVSYSGTSTNKLGDGSGLDNNITTISSFSAKDKAQPQLVSGYAKSVHNGADIIKIGFSEPISPIKPGIISGDILGVGGVSLDGALITYSNGDRNISIELNESKDQGYIPDESISVDILNTAKDKNGNYFTRYILDPEIPVVLEKIKPKLLSVVKLGDKKDFIISFDEVMSEFTYNDVGITYNGTGIPTGGNIAIAEVIQSKNKKTAIVKVNHLPAFTEVEKRIIIFSMKESVKDLVGNSIDANKSDANYTIAKDKTPPNAISFTVDINTKKIKIDFNESVAIRSFNPSAISISLYNEGNISLTSHSKATYTRDEFSTNKGSVIITLNDDINSLKSFIKNKEDFNISIYPSSGIIDFAGNAAISKDIPLKIGSGSFISDNIPPNLLSWDYDLDNKKMILNFDEPMKIVDYDATDIKISDNNNTTSTNRLPFDGNKSSARIISDKSIEITLFSSQIIKILTDDLAKEINKTFLEIDANSGFKDIKGNSVKTRTNASALRAKTYKADKNNFSKLNLVSNVWNHISIDKPTKINDIMASGKISHIYTYSNEVWYPSPATIDPKIGYWIKVGDHNSILKIPSNSKTYIKGKKEDDLARIKSQTSGVFHLIGIENNLSYEEMYNSKNSACKSVRIHHYDASSISSSAGWDINSTVLENSSLWIQCVK